MNMAYSKAIVVVGCNKERTMRFLGKASSDLIIIKVRDNKGNPLDYSHIKRNVDSFLRHARKNINDKFNVTPIGRGLVGICPNVDIAPMFADAPINCKLPKKWELLLPKVEGREFWFC